MSIDKNLVESFDLEGRWGLPDSPASNWLHGKAHFDPRGGISLEIDGLLGDLPTRIPSKLDSYDAVYGVTSDAKRVTLLKVMGGLGGMSFGPAGANVRGRYHASRMIAGEYLASWSDQKYRDLRIQFHNLEEFLGKHASMKMLPRAQLRYRSKHRHLLSSCWKGYLLKASTMVGFEATFSPDEKSGRKHGLPRRFSLKLISTTCYQVRSHLSIIF